MKEEINSAWADAVSFCLRLKKIGFNTVKTPERKILMVPVHSMPDDFEGPKDFFTPSSSQRSRLISIKIP